MVEIFIKQGGNNLPEMMKEICGQTKAADMEITFVQYVLASGSLDNLGPDSPQLYTHGMEQKYRQYFRGL